MGSFVLNNMQRLKSIEFDARNDHLSESVDPFIIQMLKQFHETLQYMSISRFAVPNISFPNLKTMQIEIGEDIYWEEFQDHFPHAIKNMERLETVKLVLIGIEYSYKDTVEEIGNHYEKHCISANCALQFPPQQILDIVPVKILTGVYDLLYLNDVKHGHGIQFLSVKIDTEKSMEYGWRNYIEIFDQFSSLQAIEFIPYDKNWPEGNFLEKNTSKYSRST